MNWLQALIDFVQRKFLALWPLAKVYTTQQAVRVRFGHLMPGELGPGLHWKLPIADEIWRVSVNERTIDLREGSVSTLDRKAIVVSGNLSYRIGSARTLWLNVHDFDNSLANLALGRICSDVARKGWDDLRENREALEIALLARVNEEVASWGVEVTRLHLTDLVEARQYRMFSQSYNYMPSNSTTPPQASTGATVGPI